MKTVKNPRAVFATVKYRVVEDDGVNGSTNIISYNGPRQKIQARNEIYRLPHMIISFKFYIIK